MAQKCKGLQRSLDGFQGVWDVQGICKKIMIMESQRNLGLFKLVTEGLEKAAFCRTGIQEFQGPTLRSGTP